MKREADHYAALDLPRAATDAEIKRRYRRLMRQVHPDANTNDPAATRKAARLNAAFETLGHAGRRREYDERTAPPALPAAVRRSDAVYAHIAEQPDWEDIVVERVKRPARTPHVHRVEPEIAPDEIAIDLAELRAMPRVRRRLTITNPCDCTLRGDVSTSQPWLWGPIGPLEVPPHGRVSFEVEAVSRKVAFPGVADVLFVAKDWTASARVVVTGYEAKRRPPQRQAVAARRPAR